MIELEKGTAMTITEKLAYIQKTLKAPKGQFNQFGKYRYRSQEDILEAVKPHLDEVGVALILGDNLECIGNRYYIKATATLVSVEDKNEYVSTCAYAREEETKKGMDGSQITGTASSYARKYALNGLFCIDDTKDADTDEYKVSKDKKAEEQKRRDDYEKAEAEDLAKKVTPGQVDVLNKMLTDNQAAWVLETYKVGSLEELTNEQYGSLLRTLNEREKRGSKGTA